MIDQAQLKITYQTMLKIFLSIVAGLFLFMGIMYYEMSQQSGCRPFAEIIAVISIVAFGLSFVVKPMILKKSMGRVSANDSKEVLKPLVSATLASWALYEVAVLAPAALVFLGHNRQELLFAIILAVMGFGVHFPRYSDWEQWAQNQGV